MNRLLLFCALLLSPSLSSAASEYQLEIALKPQQQQLIGSTQLEVSKSFLPLKLDLAHSCSVDRVTLQGEELPYKHRNQQLTVAVRTDGILSINYQCRFNDKVAETPIHNEDPSYGVSATISPRGSYLSSGVAWYPRLPDEEFHYRISVRAPTGIEAVTSGKRVEHSSSAETTHSQWLIDYPLHGITLAAGRYQIFADLDGKVPIYAYFYADSSPLAETYLREARNYLELYEELFGPYPFHKFAIVENFFPTGYGLPSWTLLGSSVIKLPFIVKTSLGHEIAHSWWGSGVQVDYSQGNWAEGLTTYVADYLYQERSSAAEARAYRLKILRDYASLVNADNRFAIKQFRSRYNKASQAIGYGKTAMLFHMLRQQIGDAAFWKGLRAITTDKMFASVGWDDFSAVFSKTSGRDLDSYFDRWLSNTEGPTLAFRDVQAHNSGGGWTVTGTLQQSGSLYPLDIELQVETESGDKNYLLEMRERQQTFQIEMAARPLALTADPEAHLFRILAAEEIPSTVNSIRGSQDLLVIQGEQNSPPAEAMQTLLGAMRKRHLQIEKLAAVSQTELRQHDLLIFGEAPQLSPLVDAAPAEDQSIFTVQRNPFNPQKSAAWFISKSSQATVVARKVPHYGKYSLLKFSGPTNQHKEIVPPENSPLKVKF